MASSEKTTALGLNKWRGTDIPVREDFVRDNELIDNAVAQLMLDGGSGSGGSANDPRLDDHLANQSVHLSESDRQALGAAGPTVGSYTGDGQIYQGIVLGFRPRYGFVFADNLPLMEPGATGTFLNSRSGILTAQGCTKGLEATATGFKVYQAETGSVAGTVYQGVNKSGVKYVYIMWK